ncbi:penicillin-binding protein [Kordiimonas sediminis]|uniref:Penicillin-binding protein n=1 Tax=Kordiimonas sediminis TaxID=1735581 RepID=A0A919AQ79_9PROT|nr:serine hydrolase [Kordiimonas sediminis]GHF20175.1 penicillin-binding protein [Kordiimonas sediminis]
MSRYLLSLVFLAGVLSGPGAGTEDDQTVSPINSVVSKLERGDYEGVNGMMITHGGRTWVAYSPKGNPVRKQDIRSATKSITAILVGELLEDKRLKSVKVRVADILPEEFAHMEKDDPRRSIQVRDLLTMQSGLACDDWVPSSVGQEDKMYKTNDWAAFILSQPVAYERGQHFSYCTGGVVLLGRLLEKLSGQPVPEFARERLFAPLGINGEKWDKTPKGFTDTGGHLRITLADLHKIGLLVQQGGVWEGVQLIEPDWLSEMTSKHASVPGRRETYGYLWWRMMFPAGEGKEVLALYAHGNGGNFTFFFPDLDLVATFTATNYGSRKQFIPMRILMQEILPALTAR